MSGYLLTDIDKLIIFVSGVTMIGLCARHDNNWFMCSTSAVALTNMRQYLRMFLSSFNVTSNQRVVSLEDTISAVQEYFSYQEQSCLVVQTINQTQRKTQGPDGTISHQTLESIRMILTGLNEVKDNIVSVNRSYLPLINAKSLVSLFVENLFEKMRGGQTATPMVYDFALRFNRATKETLKSVTDTGFNYFTNEKASYYLRPKVDHFSIKYAELPKMPKPAAGNLPANQVTQMRNWVALHGKSVRQLTTRNTSTKDKAGTLPVNLYDTPKPKEVLLDFNSICERTQTNANNDASKAEISIPKGSFVAVPRCFRQPSLPESTFYLVKIVSDITDTTDEQVHVKGEWYFQDVIEPLFFVTTSEVEFVSRKGIVASAGTVQVIDRETVCIDEEEYYTLLAVTRNSKDNETEDEILQELCVSDSIEASGTSNTGHSGSLGSELQQPPRKKNANNDDFVFY